MDSSNCFVGTAAFLLQAHALNTNITPTHAILFTMILLPFFIVNTPAREILFYLYVHLRLTVLKQIPIKPFLFQHRYHHDLFQRSFLIALVYTQI